MKRTLFFKAGSAIAFTRGEYSDFGIEGIVVTMRDCDLLELGKEYLAEHGDPERGEEYARWEAPDFPSWLVVKGYAFPANIQTVHTGDYGRLELG